MTMFSKVLMKLYQWSHWLLIGVFVLFIITRSQAIQTTFLILLFVVGFRWALIFFNQSCIKKILIYESNPVSFSQLLLHDPTLSKSPVRLALHGDALDVALDILIWWNKIDVVYYTGVEAYVLKEK